MYAELWVEQTSYFTVFADGNSHYSAASKSAVVDCVAGQQVVVRAPSSASSQMYSDATARYSTFSGFLLQATATPASRR